MKSEDTNDKQRGWSLLTFHEKSAWVVLLATLAVYIPYFGYLVALNPSVEDGMQLLKSVFPFAIVAMIVLMIIGHVGIAIVDYRREGEQFDEADERDTLIEMKSHRYASFVTEATLILVLIGIYIGYSPFYLVHAGILGLGVATVTDFTSKIIAYRGMR